MRPSSENEVLTHQAYQVQGKDRHACVREFQEGEKVMVIIIQERVGYLEEYYKEPDLYHIELKYMSMVTGEDMQINSGS